MIPWALEEKLGPLHMEKRKMARKKTLLLTLLVVLTAAALPVPGAWAAQAVQYYVSLGDSLAAGIQPDRNGVNEITDDAYTDLLHKRVRGQIPGLKHVKLGCPGETTITMIVGGICDYPSGSQLDEAVAFLLAHPSEVAFITINLGANDLLVCDPTDPDIDLCVAAQFLQVANNLPVSLATLQFVAPGVPILGMNYYNANLGAWVIPGGPLGEAIAELTTELIFLFNDLILDPVYGFFAIPVADVTAAFDTGDFSAEGNLPHNVRVICRLTWMCDPDRGPNIHANKNGYKVIARTFQRLMKDLGLL